MKKVLYISLSLFFILFSFSYGMEQLPTTELIIRLQNDKKIEKPNYNRIYFQAIANAIHIEYKVLEYDFNEHALSLLNQYDTLLKFHARRYIKQLIKSPSSQENKIKLLKEAFPQDNSILKTYFNEGLHNIKTKEIQKLENYMQFLMEERQRQDEKKKIKLLNLIIKIQQKKELHINLDDYKPEDFKKLFNDIEEAEKNKQDPTELLDQVKEKAITYINYIATHNKEEGTNEKLAEIEKHLSPFTLFYLQKALEYDMPERKAPQKQSTVEKVLEEKSEKEFQKPKTTETIIEEQPIQPYQAPQSITQQQPAVSTPPSLKEEKPKPEKSPQGFLSNLATSISQAATFVWQGITSFLSYIYNSIFESVPK